ncbi:MAG: hypothetical protein Q9170_005413, partial [Blastenia crenularia]
RGLVFDDTDAKVFVPHAIRADGGGAEVGEDGGPGGVGDEGDVVFDLEFVGQEAEVVDAGGVVGVTDGADEAGKGAKEKGMVFLRPELSYAEDSRVPVPFARFVKRNSVDDFVNRDGRKDDGNGVWFPSLGADGTPECADMGGGPRTVCHYEIDRAANTAIEVGEKMPVFLLERTTNTFACAGIETFSQGGRGVKRAKHVGGDSRVVNVGSRRDRGKEEFAESKGKGVAHGVDEDIGNEKGECIICEDDGT